MTSGALDARELLECLIAIRSVNPLLPGAINGDGEADIARFVGDYLEAAGIAIEMQDVMDGRCNVIANLERRGDADEAVILLTSHMDTYPAGGPRSDYVPVRDGDLLYGRGSADAKGPLAAMMTAFVAAAGADSRRAAYLVATVDEECMLQGAKHLVSHEMRPTLGITGEPTSLAPIVAQKGIVRGAIRVRGPKAHAAYPAGNDAVSAAARVITAVQELNRSFAEQAHPELGPPTLTVTRVCSDGGMNLVARAVTLFFDGRFLPGTTGAEFAATVARMLRERLSAEIKIDPLDLTFVSPANECPMEDPGVAEFCAAVEAVTGRCSPEIFSYGSEAGVLAEICTATLVFGPGDARYSHAETEVIELVELDAAVDVFRRTLTGVASRARPL